MPEKRSPQADGDKEGSSAKKRRFSLDPSIITVNVGKDKVHHLLHENILTQCPFFERCLNSGMREQNEKVINLPEDDLKSFLIIVEWLYTNTIRSELGYWEFLPAYSAADKYGMPGLQNVIMDRLRALLWQNLEQNMTLSTVWVTYIWEHTVDGCKVRKMALDFFHYNVATRPAVYAFSSDDTTPAAKQMHLFMANTERGLALVFRLANNARSTPRNPVSKVGCFYHVHEDGKKCGKSG